MTSQIQNILRIKRSYAIWFLISLISLVLVEAFFFYQMTNLPTVENQYIYIFIVGYVVFVLLILLLSILLTKPEQIERFILIYVLVSNLMFFPIGVLASYFYLSFMSLWYVGSLLFHFFYYSFRKLTHWSTMLMLVLFALSFVCGKLSHHIEWLNYYFFDYYRNFIVYESEHTLDIFTNVILWANFLAMVYTFFFVAYTLAMIARINDLKSSQKLSLSDPDAGKNTPNKEDQLRKIYSQIVAYLEQKQSYKDSDFTMVDLSKALKMNQTYISQAIGVGKGVGFRQFINEYRLREAKKMMLENERNNYTLKYIYTSCGFQNQSTFNKVFKSIEGVTPTDYFKNQSGKG